MTIRVAGFPGTKTDRTLATVEEAVELVGEGMVTVEWISDARAMNEIGVMQTPSVFVNENIKVAGRLPSMHEVMTWVEEELAALELAEA